MTPGDPAWQELAPGLHAWVDPGGGWGRSNAGLIVAGDEALLIDTQWDERATRAMLDAAPLGPNVTIRTLINTHADGDHTWGNAAVGAEQVIATVATVATIARGAIACGAIPRSTSSAPRRTRTQCPAAGSRWRRSAASSTLATGWESTATMTSPALRPALDAALSFITERTRTIKIPCAIVGTKVDRLGPEKQKIQRAKMALELGLKPEDIYWVSSHKGYGMNALKTGVMKALNLI